MWPAFLIFNKNRRYKKFHSDFKIKIVKIQSDKFRTQDTGRSIAKTRKFKRTQAFNFIFFTGLFASLACNLNLLNQFYFYCSLKNSKSKPQYIFSNVNL